MRSHHAVLAFNGLALSIVLILVFGSNIIYYSWSIEKDVVAKKVA